jgi:chromate transporter
VTLAIGAAVLVLAVPSTVAQIGVILLGGLIGWRWVPADREKKIAQIVVPFDGARHL